MYNFAIILINYANIFCYDIKDHKVKKQPTHTNQHKSSINHYHTLKNQIKTNPISPYLSLLNNS